MLKSNLEAVVAGETSWDRRRNVPESRNRTTRLQGRERRAGGGKLSIRDRPRLVEITKQWEFDAAVSDVSHINDCVGSDGMLYCKVPVLDIAPGHVALQIQDHIARQIGRIP